MDRYQDKIGCFIQIPNIGRGKIKYIGSVESKPGTFVGVDLLANIGKNNGIFNGNKYFDTEYPRSGLFIQLSKVIDLIENATLSTVTRPPRTSSVTSNGSRRSTLGSMEHSMTLPRQRINVSNMVNNSLTRPVAGMDEQKSPTPMRSLKVNGSELEYSNIVDIHDDIMDIDPPYSVPRKSSVLVTNHESTTQIINEYELRFEKQQRTILEYEKLLNDQRVILEDIQHVIDVCENQSQELELERDQLKILLETEREQQQRQKEYFETEHEQLMDVVTRLHEEIKENEKRVVEENQRRELEKEQNQGKSFGTVNNDAVEEELNSLRNYKHSMENASIKWEKEKEQLRMHNDSLSKEYQVLNKEMMSMSVPVPVPVVANNDADELTKQIEEFKSQLLAANVKIKHMSMTAEQSYKYTEMYKDEPPTQSLPLYQPEKTIDAAAGRKLWCVLCEKSGHEQTECPFQYQNNTDLQGLDNNDKSNNPMYF